MPVSKFEVGGGLKLADVFDADLTEIYKGSKNHHLKEIAKKSGVDLKVGLYYPIYNFADVGRLENPGIYLGFGSKDPDPKALWQFWTCMNKL